MALECTLLKKTIWKNSSSIICVNCNQQCQLRCYYPKAKKKVEDWLCSLCLPSVSPYSGICDLSTFDDDKLNQHVEALRKLDENRNLLSLVTPKCDCESGSHFGNIDSIRFFLLVLMIVACQHNLLIYPREIIFNFF